MTRAYNDRRRGNDTKWKAVRFRYWEERFYYESGEALEQVAQGGCGSSSSDWMGFELHGLVHVIPAHDMDRVGIG